MEEDGGELKVKRLAEIPWVKRNHFNASHLEEESKYKRHDAHLSLTFPSGFFPVKIYSPLKYGGWWVVWQIGDRFVWLL